MRAIKRELAALMCLLCALTLCGCASVTEAEDSGDGTSRTRSADLAAVPDTTEGDTASDWDWADWWDGDWTDGETDETSTPDGQSAPEEADLLPEDGTYSSRDDVALYLHTYGKLPGNFITKKEARALGWSGGSLEPYAPGKCIGGDRFGNYEGILPQEYAYQECDIDTLGAKSRGAKRLVFSGAERIYYTEDHYQTFTMLYGEETT